MTIKGFVDTHNHQFANLGFGGREVFGAPGGKVDNNTLPWCIPVHGPGGVSDVIGTIVKWMYGRPGIGHKVGGYDQFDGWPRHDSVTHQAVHREWLERAWQGGMRVMVMLAVNNEWMTQLPGFQLAPGRTGRDMEAVQFQLAAAHALQAEIDNDSGGPGKGWYRIVTSPEQARTVAEDGKLAVVLGVEVDYLLDSYPHGLPLTVATMRQGVAQLAAQGVRYVFPIHFGDNQFGATAIQNALEASVPAPLVTPLGLLPLPYVVAEEDGKAQGYQYRGGQQNARGLTDLGKALIHELITQGILFDVDHMSHKARADALDIAESFGCPVLSGHSGFIDVCAGDKRHEGQLTGAEVDRIAALGGMVSPIVAQGTLDTIHTYVRPDGTSVPHICGYSDNTLVQAYLYAVHRTAGGKVGLGTDLNGFAGLPGPTSGPEAQYGANPVATVTSLEYPFVAPSGVQMARSTIGKKTFDLNVDGLAHVGMLPDLIAHFRAQGVNDWEMQPIMRSAEDFVALWSDAVVAGGKNPYQRFLLQTATPIVEADADANFVFLAGDYGGDGREDAYCLKVRDTESGQLEVHVLGQADGYQSFLLHAKTPITSDDATANFEFATARRSSWFRDIFCIKRAHTGSDKVEVHVLSGSTGFSTFVLQVPTPIDLSDAPNFRFELGDYNGDTKPDLYCLKVANTGSGRFEVHILSGSSNYQQFLLQTATPIAADDAAAHFDFDTIRNLAETSFDLIGVKTSGTASDKVEVHVLKGSSNYQQFLLQTPTLIDKADAENFVFAAADFLDFNSDGYPDLMCFKKHAAATGRLEVHVLSGW